MGDKTQQVSLTTNQKIVKWVHGKLKNKVGRGECWDLAENALIEVDAQTSNDLGPVGPDTDYIWGDPIKITDVIPGDILQFRNHKVTITTQTKYTFSDGSYETVTETSEAQRNHHTAIVNGKIDANGGVNTYEQHVKPLGNVVQNKKLYTRSVAPSIKISVEKRENPHTKKLESAKAAQTITITVTGTIWAYRPKPKK